MSDTTALEPYESQDQAVIAHPITGEAIDLASAPDEELAGFVADLKRDMEAVKDVRRIVDAEVIRRMDRQASWTLRAGPFQLRSASPEPEEQFDGPALRDALYALADEGVISVAAADAAVETVTSYKPRKAGINALRKLGGRVKETVDRHAFLAEKRRYVTVQRGSERV